jgi:putative acetyltransferase
MRRGPVFRAPAHFPNLLDLQIKPSRLEEWHMIIRPERESDIDVIFAVTKAAFEDHPISNHTEQYIVNALRAAKALSLSLVAEVDGQVIGHIAFSPVTIADGSDNWYGIGPVSVLPAFQRRGYGKALINEGLARLKASGAQGCLLVGDPNYYKRFGFRNLPELSLAGVPPENFLGLPFGEHIPNGAVTFHQAFSATAEQFKEGCWLSSA